MTILSQYRRRCDSCKKEMDVNYTICTIRGKEHFCMNCATIMVKHYLKIGEIFVER